MLQRHLSQSLVKIHAMVNKNKLFINFQFPAGENPSSPLKKLFYDFQDFPYDLLSAMEMRFSFLSF